MTDGIEIGSDDLAVDRPTGNGPDLTTESGELAVDMWPASQFANGACP